MDALLIPLLCEAICTLADAYMSRRYLPLAQKVVRLSHANQQESHDAPVCAELRKATQAQTIWEGQQITHHIYNLRSAQVCHPANRKITRTCTATDGTGVHTQPRNSASHPTEGVGGVAATSTEVKNMRFECI